MKRRLKPAVPYNSCYQRIVHGDLGRVDDVIEVLDLRSWKFYPAVILKRRWDDGGKESLFLTVKWLSYDTNPFELDMKLEHPRVRVEFGTAELLAFADKHPKMPTDTPIEVERLTLLSFLELPSRSRPPSGAFEEKCARIKTEKGRRYANGMWFGPTLGFGRRRIGEFHFANGIKTGCENFVGECTED